MLYSVPKSVCLSLLIFASVGFPKVMGVSHPDPKYTKAALFCYDPNLPCGPASWGGTCTSGTRQSPIDISGLAYKRLAKIGLNKPYIVDQNGFFARNTGHTLQVQFVDSANPTSSLEFDGAGLHGVYRLAQFHFHWGSEHTFKGVRYPLEAHLVHYNTKHASFMDAANAVNDPKALAVIAVVFELGKHNPALDNVIRAGQNSIKEDPLFTSYSGKIKVQDLLPYELSYVRYYGSLTTPPCSENVVWTVFKTPNYLSLDQLSVFLQLLDDNMMLFNNFRPTQPLNGRKLEQYKVPLLRRSVAGTKQELVTFPLYQIFSAIFQAIFAPFLLLFSGRTAYGLRDLLVNLLSPFVTPLVFSR